MATLEYLRDEMQSALEISEDSTEPAIVRHAARNRFWHCYQRVGFLERSGLTEDDCGHYLRGYGDEIERHAPAKPRHWQRGEDARSARADAQARKAEVQIKAREEL